MIVVRISHSGHSIVLRRVTSYGLPVILQAVMFPPDNSGWLMKVGGSDQLHILGLVSDLCQAWF